MTTRMGHARQVHRDLEAGRGGERGRRHGGEDRPVRARPDWLPHLWGGRPHDGHPGAQRSQETGRSGPDRGRSRRAVQEPAQLCWHLYDRRQRGHAPRRYFVERKLDRHAADAKIPPRRESSLSVRATLTQPDRRPHGRAQRRVGEARVTRFVGWAKARRNAPSRRDAVETRRAHASFFGKAARVGTARIAWITSLMRSVLRAFAHPTE